MTRAYFSLGSNVGDRGGFLRGAVPTVAGGDPWRVSRVYVTEPVGGVEQDDFWNLVLEIETLATAQQLLERAREAEARAGRTREVRWGPRTLDVDVLLVGDEHVRTPELEVPHPRLYERTFVLAPLRELRPDLVSDAQLRAGHGAVAVLGTLETLE